MDIEKLEKLAEFKKKGILTQEEFDAEKKKLFNAEEGNTSNRNDSFTTSDDKDEIKISVSNEIYDLWHEHRLKIQILVVLIIVIGYTVVNSEKMNGGQWIVLFGISAFLGLVLKEYQRQSKNVKDLHRYRSIEEVIARFGTPDDIREFGEYTKYVFKKSTNGWGWHKYQTDIFTTQRGKLVKHENFYE